MNRIREMWKFVELVAVVDRFYPPADLVRRGSWKKAGYYYNLICSKGRGPNRRELQIAVVGILMYIFSTAKITFLEVQLMFKLSFGVLDLFHSVRGFLSALSLHSFFPFHGFSNCCSGAACFCLRVLVNIF